ncbi:hypothetical protein [uncultured Brachyspira sp.]|uniref:hypothetical protein n=1 Tax=uncultured Brachyspira sp. TaxID=221953 RepID=UPI0025ED1683|nr:hypothetical protein [uncultured Brachyspira sp.]
MNIVFLMGGDNLNISADNYPIYMTEINQRMILERLIDFAKYINPKQSIFCIRENDIKNFYVDEIIKRKIEDAVIINIRGNTKGAVCSSLLASEYIDNDNELLIAAINDFTDENWIDIINYFRENNYDLGIVSFNSIHPRYSFAILDNNGEVIEISEKKPLSNNALVSFYYFKNGYEYIKSSQNVIRKDSPINNCFYLSQVVNEMILEQKRVGLYKIDNSKFHPLKNETQLAQYILELKEKIDTK